MKPLSLSLSHGFVARGGDAEQLLIATLRNPSAQPVAFSSFQIGLPGERVVAFGPSAYVASQYWTHDLAPDSQEDFRVYSSVVQDALASEGFKGAVQVHGVVHLKDGRVLKSTPVVLRI